MIMLEEKVLKTIQKYELIQNGDTIVIGVSGGPDSMALFHTLIQLKINKKIEYELIVAHINHGIRLEAEEETKYVEQFCHKQGIPCYVKRQNVEELAKKQKVGTEEAGRRLRYTFFDEVAKAQKASKIVTAHNANDNAETVLMNLMRGSGTSGLKGIEVKRDNRYIRPLIECTRKEIETYCIEHHLEPKQDKTNRENSYTRNRIRNILIPLLEREFNPNIVSSLNRLAELMARENEYLETQTRKVYQEICIEENIGSQELEGKESIVLDLTKFNQQEEVIKNRLLRYTITRLFKTSQNIEKVHIADIVRLCQKNIGNKHLTPNKNIKIMVNKGKIFFEKQTERENKLP